MASILNLIHKAVASEKKLLTVLIDPDKFDIPKAKKFLQTLPEQTDFLFVGGSSVEDGRTDSAIKALKAGTEMPVVLFPGDYSQISDRADGILFLSLISGRNPEYLINQQVKASGILRKSSLEIISTGYILIDGGKESTVEQVSGTKALSQDEVETIVHTALAGEYSGQKVIYLEAGSGAVFPVGKKIISEVKKAVSVPVVVGGGIRSLQQLEDAYSSGADIVVIGTAFEEGSWQL